MNGYRQWPYGDDNMPGVGEADDWVWSGDASGGSGDDPDVGADSSDGPDPKTA